MFHLSAASGRERPVKSKNELRSCAIVGSATVPTNIGGHGDPPYGPKHLKFHISAAAGLNGGQFNRKRNE